MKIKYIKKTEKNLVFKIELDNDEGIGIGQGGAEISLLHNIFSFDFPVIVEKIHPDLIAVALLTVVLPWAKESIIFPEKVSVNFANAVDASCGIRVTGIDENLQSREFGKIDSVSFSGGVDSVAVTQIIPENSIKLMFLRKKHSDLEDNQLHYSIRAQKEISGKFDNSYYVESDLEHIVDPMPQYPTWMALSSQCILLADHFNLKSINFGTIVGSAEIKEGKEYKRINKPDTMWAELLKSVGLHLSKPVAGITEIGTSLIVSKTGLDQIATSCQFGSMNKPCMKCFKCFRKYFMTISVNDVEISNDIIDEFLKQKNIQNYILGNPPMYFQHIFMYALQKISTSNTHSVIKLFKEKILLGNENVGWCEKYYDCGIERFVPD